MSLPRRHLQAAPRPSRARRTQEERRDETRKALLRSAIDTIAAHGFAATTTHDIADRAGVTRGAIQHHFPTRADFLVAVLDEMLAMVDFALPVEALRGLPLGERIEQWIAHYRRACGKPAYTAAVSMWLGDLSREERNAKVRERANALQAAIDRDFFLLFDDVGLPEERMVSLRRLALDTIRGRALLGMIGVVSDDEAEFRLLADLLLDALAGGTGGAGPA